MRTSEKRRESQLKWRLANREAISISGRAYRMKNKAKIREYMQQNKDRINVLHYEWAKKNPEKIRLARKKYKQTHKKERREYEKKWRASNPLKTVLKVIAYQKKNRVSVNAAAARRRRLQYAVDEKFRQKIWARKITSAANLNGVCCSICGSTENLEWHHNDYSDPYDVSRVCRSCHREKIHGQPGILRKAKVSI